MLLLPEVQKKIIGRKVTIVVDELNGYTTVPAVINGVEYRTLAADENSKLDGGIISVTPNELISIDAYEPPEYKRINVTTVGGITAWVYVKRMTNSVD